MSNQPGTRRTISNCKWIAVLLLAIQEYSCIPLDAKVSRPPEFAGRWARLVSDTSWSDTIELVPDGRVRGWKAATSDSSHWAVVQSHYGDALCIGLRRQPNCQPYRLEGDTMVLGRTPKQSYWRRAR
jgi:hypothetical protein